MSVFFWLCLTAVLTGQPTGPEPGEPVARPESDGPLATLKHEAVRQVAPDSYVVGGIRVNGASKEIRFPAKINLNEGLIEVVICTERGKLHESVLVASIQPLHLHLALLLLGLREGRNPGWHISADPALRLPGWDGPPGDMVEVYVSWETPEGPCERRAERLLMDVRTGETLPNTSWVFVGSRVSPRGAYAADESGSIMTNYHDRLAVLDNPLEAGRVDDFTFANSALIPKRGTPVEVRMVAAATQRGEKNDE